ncbi:MAG TPA: hypothetical protein VF042_02610 [Gemmatimonadaceae bacterium]
MPPRALLVRFNLVFLFLAFTAASAQEDHTGHNMEMDSSRGPTVSAGASAILLGTVASPGVNDRTLAEGYLTQPIVMAMLMTRGGRFIGDLTLDFEGATLKRGELNAGVHGEGYIDRRHPHTLVHELIGTGIFGGGVTKLSITGGKGFVPFGTDDPMSRPFVKYPVNHHLAQILERGLVMAALNIGPVTGEASLFNGDEPTGPYDLPDWDRFGDSWSSRVTLRQKHLEAQASYARVESPEHSEGGLNHRKISTSARYENHRAYGLVEWAQSKEGEGNTTDFTFRSVLGEGSLKQGRFIFAARAERTERPEHERDINPFRTPQPHSDLGIIGITRWDVLSGSIAAELPSYRKVRLSTFIEVSTQHPTSRLTPSVFDPAEFYGASRLWNFSVGAGIGAGMKHERMGRYGVAASNRMTH